MPPAPEGLNGRPSGDGATYGPPRAGAPLNLFSERRELVSRPAEPHQRPATESASNANNQTRWACQLDSSGADRENQMMIMKWNWSARSPARPLACGPTNRFAGLSRSAGGSGSFVLALQSLEQTAAWQWPDWGNVSQFGSGGVFAPRAQAIVARLATRANIKERLESLALAHCVPPLLLLLLLLLRSHSNLNSSQESENSNSNKRHHRMNGNLRSRWC